MARTRANPFRGFVDMITEMERARRLGTTGHDTPRSGRGQTRTEADSWVPPADIYTSGDDLVIRLEVPGVSGSDIEVTLTEGVLSISGEVDTRRHDDATIYVLECHHGTFRRDMILPPAIEQEHVQAVLDDGVVEITVTGAAIAVPGTQHIPVSDRSRPQVLRGHQV